MFIKGGQMKFYKHRMKRIRASDKSLVFSFSASWLTGIFFLLFIVFNIKHIIQIDWKNINLLSMEDILFSFTTYNVFY